MKIHMKNHMKKCQVAWASDFGYRVSHHTGHLENLVKSQALCKGSHPGKKRLNWRHCPYLLAYGHPKML